MQEKIKITKTEVLSDKWGILNEVEFKLKSSKGKWLDLKRESYDTGNGAAVLLYNPKTKRIILTQILNYLNLWKSLLYLQILK